MSESSKAADDWASYERNCDGPVEDTFLAGARALLEWARSRQVYGTNIDGNPTPFGTVNLSDLEAYFAEEKK